MRHANNALGRADIWGVDRCTRTSKFHLRKSAVTQLRGGGGGGDGPRATITPQACSPIRLDHSRSKPTIAATYLEDFSYSTFALRTIGVSHSNAAGAASFAARMAGAGEQPGRERPHLWTPDPDPRVGSGVAHVPAASDHNDGGIGVNNRDDIDRDW